MMDELLQHDSPNSPPRVPQHELEKKHQLLFNSIPYQTPTHTASCHPPTTTTTTHHHHHLYVHSISENEEDNSNSNDIDNDNTDDEWLDQERQYYGGRRPVGMDDSESTTSGSSSRCGGGGGGGGSPPFNKTSTVPSQSFDGATAMPVFYTSNLPRTASSTAVSSTRSLPSSRHQYNHSHYQRQYTPIIPPRVSSQQQPQRTSSAGSSSSSSSGPSSPILLPPYQTTIATSSSPNNSNNNPVVFQQKQYQHQCHQRKTSPLIFSALMGFAFLGVFWYTQSYATLHNALEQVTVLTEERRRVHVQFRDVEKDIQHLQRKLFELDQGVFGAAGGGGGGALVDDNDNKNNLVDSESYRAVTNNLGDQNNDLINEMVALHESLSEGNTQIVSLQHHIQEMSRRDAQKKYGSGVIRVQLELAFPEDHVAGGEQQQPHQHLQHLHKKEKPTTMILEMAPLELMPHSVNMFLDMVHAGLFDGCSFVLMAMHMIKLAPLPYDGSSASAKVRSFTQHGLETVAFREYSPDYPHEEYTVAFAADGSPSFYINTQDNTEIHVGEPCFAKIVSGFDTVQRLASAPTRGGIWYRRRIGLKRATIL
jgi:cyclophilin family peptidyl-prolyl cis-trans isomerase